MYLRLTYIIIRLIYTHILLWSLETAVDILHIHILIYYTAAECPAQGPVQLRLYYFFARA